MGRRLRLAIIVVVSQMLLIALAIAWLVHMVIIAINGSAYFVENNRLVLFAEIGVSVLITIFGLWVLVLQMERLGERRAADRGVSPEAGMIPLSEERDRQDTDYHAINGKGVQRPPADVVQEQPDSRIAAAGRRQEPHDQLGRTNGQRPRAD
jgi:ABC-type nickel/cobalt efflux system permease component RcnA